ncbi:MAG TPA: translocation/assembly module TamB domain-containing protein [Caulobacteraceae bacterium]
MAAGPPHRPLAAPAWLIIAAVVLVAIIGAVAMTLRYAPLTTVGRDFVEAQVDGLKVGRLGRLKIAGVRGDPWRRFTVARLTIADTQGIWLDARDLTVQWRWRSLLQRRFHVDFVAARTVEVLRRPVLSAPERPRRSPLAIDVNRASARVVLTPAFSGTRGVFDVGGVLQRERSGSARGALVALSALHRGDFLRARFDLHRSRQLLLVATAREAVGGALAGALGLPADQPFSLSARANGSMGAGSFSVIATSGPSSPLAALGAWSGAGGWARGEVQLASSRLLAPYQAALGPQVRFAMAGRRAADGFYALDLTAQSRNAGLSARGEADIGRRSTGPGGIAFDARVADAGAIFPGPTLGPMRVVGGLGGDAARWSAVGKVTLAGLRQGGFSLTSVSGPVRLEAKAGAIDISLAATGAGGRGGGLAAALLGAAPRVTADATRFADGRMLIRRLHVIGAGAKVQAEGRVGLFGDLSFSGQANMANLAAAKSGAKGVILASWSAKQAGTDRPWSFSIDAKASDFASGLAEADRLLGGSPRLSAKASYDRGIVAISHASLGGAAGAVTAAGQMGPGGALRLKLDWRARGPLDLGPLEIAGAAVGSGALTGTLTSPRADLLADFDHVDLPYLPLDKAHLVLSFLGGDAGANGRFSLTGDSAYGPAAGSARFAFAPKGVDVSALAVNAAGVTAAGSLALRDNAPSSADLRLTAGPGALLSEGRATGTLRIVDASGGARAAFTLEAANAVLRQGALAVKSLKVSADGPLARLPYVASAQGVAPSGPWKIAGAGLITETPGGRLATFSGDGRARGIGLRTLEPAEIRFESGGLFARLRLGAGAGRANIDVAQTKGTMTASASLSDLGLNLINADLIGRIDANLTLAGAGPDLHGQMDARLTGAGGRDLAEAAPVDGVIKASLAGGSLTVDAALTNASGLRARTDIVLPAEASAAPFRIAINRTRALSGQFAVNGELRPVWDLLMGGDRSLAGRLSAAGSISGTLADPRAIGTAALDNGAFEDAETGLKLTGVTVHAVLADNAIDVRQFSAGDGAKGSVTGAGALSLARQGLSSFRLDLRSFRLLDNDLAQAAASGQLIVSRAGDGKVKLTGALAIDRAQIAPNPPVASGVVPMEVVELNKPAELEERQPQQTRAGPVALDVAFKAPGGIFVKGRGLNVELSLDAHVAGTTQDPILTGVARVVRGDYDFAGKRFQIDERGVVYLGSSAETIRLDLTAVRDDPTLTAVIRIQGTAAKPRITLSSTPTLPTDEILSQVLFGAAAAQLPALQAAQLASALSTLSGGGGFDVIGGLRRFARLDRLGFGGDATTGATIAGGKYLNNNVYLELTGGGRQGPTAQLEWRVRKHLSVVSSVARQGDTRLSVRWRKDY